MVNKGLKEENTMLSFGKQQINRTLQQVMYMSLDKTITPHTAQAFAKVSLAVAASTILGDVLWFILVQLLWCF